MGILWPVAARSLITKVWRREFESRYRKKKKNYDSMQQNVTRKSMIFTLKKGEHRKSMHE
jgi:hypothetical protein